MENPRCALWLDMGFGKTATVLWTIHLLKQAGELRCALVVAPKRVAEEGWPDELLEWPQFQDLSCAQLPARVAKDGRAALALARKHDVLFIGRDNLAALVKALGRKHWPFDLLVLDESRSFASPTSARFKAARHVRDLTPRLIELTGTPAPRSVEDLWAQMFLIDGGLRLGRTITSFRERWFTRSFDGFGWEPRPGALAEVCDAVRDVVFTIPADEYVRLLPTQVIDVKVRLPAAVAAAYEAFERDAILSVNTEAVTAVSKGVLVGKLLQIAGGGLYLPAATDGVEAPDQVFRYAAPVAVCRGRTYSMLHDAKLDALADIIEAADSPVLVFYGFQHELDRLTKRFRQARTIDSLNAIRDWNAGKVPVLLAHPASAGHGLNLQHGGSIAVWYSPTWSLELHQQANKRLDRPGQARSVRIYRLLAEATVDLDVIASLASNAADQAQVFDRVASRIKPKN